MDGPSQKPYMPVCYKIGFKADMMAFQFKYEVIFKFKSSESLHLYLTD